MPAERQERQKLGAEPVGVASRRRLAEIQARAMAADPDAVVLVEGLSDCFAVEAAAKRFGRTLENERVVCSKSSIAVFKASSVSPCCLHEAARTLPQ